MAEAVLDAFARRRHLAVEAGTGVGKSVAYLVPAVSFALRNGLGVGVATKTNTLMDQLVHGELPRLACSARRQAALRRAQGLRALSVSAQDRPAARRRRAPSRGGREPGGADGVGGAVLVGRPGRGQPALDRRDAAAGRVRGRGLHAQEMPLLPEPVLPARRAPPRRLGAHRGHEPRAALPRPRRGGRHPAAAALLDHRRGARGRERGAQAAVGGRRPPDARGAAHRAALRGARRRGGRAARPPADARAGGGAGGTRRARRAGRCAAACRGHDRLDDRRLVLRLPEGPAPRR